MKQTYQTLLEQMRITEFEITHRKLLFNLEDEDFELLKKCKSFIELKIDEIVRIFYEKQTSVPEIAFFSFAKVSASPIKSAISGTAVCIS